MKEQINWSIVTVRVLHANSIVTVTTPQLQTERMHGVVAVVSITVE